MRSMGGQVEEEGAVSHRSYPAAATDVCCLLAGAADESDEVYTRIRTVIDG